MATPKSCLVASVVRASSFAQPLCTVRLVAVQQPIVVWAQVNVADVSNDGMNSQLVANTSAASS